MYWIVVDVTSSEMVIMISKHLNFKIIENILQVNVMDVSYTGGPGMPYTGELISFPTCDQMGIKSN